jgi:Ca2+-binding EF-hand superfamily protein
MAFKFLNRSGNGRLNKDEMRASLTQLCISIFKDELNDLWSFLSYVNSFNCGKNQMDQKGIVFVYMYTREYV